MQTVPTQELQIAAPLVVPSKSTKLQRLAAALFKPVDHSVRTNRSLRVRRSAFRAHKKREAHYFNEPLRETSVSCKLESEIYKSGSKLRIHSNVA